MSAFALFVIILTCAYFFYNIAVIALDVKAMTKGEEEKVERISVSESQEESRTDNEEYTPRAVIEDTKTGGFTLSYGHPEEDDDVIAEAFEEPSPDASETGDVQPNEPTTDGQAPSTVHEDSVDMGEKEEETHETAQQGEDHQPESADEEDIPDLTVLPFKEESDAEEEEGVEEVNDAFDPTLSQPQYGITKMVEPDCPEAKAHWDEVRNMMNSVHAKGNEYKPFDIVRMINEKRDLYYKLQSTDETTKL